MVATPQTPSNAVIIKLQPAPVCREREEKKGKMTKLEMVALVLPCVGWISNYNVKDHLLVSPCRKTYL